MSMAVIVYSGIPCTIPKSCFVYMSKRGQISLDVFMFTASNKSCRVGFRLSHYDDVMMTTMASQITSLTIVYSTVYSGADQRKHQSSASLAFVRGIHRGPMNSPHKWPLARKMFPFDDVIMPISMYVSLCLCRKTYVNLNLIEWTISA